MYYCVSYYFVSLSLGVTVAKYTALIAIEYCIDLHVTGILDEACRESYRTALQIGAVMTATKLTEECKIKDPTGKPPTVSFAKAELFITTSVAVCLHKIIIFSNYINCKDVKLHTKQI